MLHEYVAKSKSEDIFSVIYALSLWHINKGKQKQQNVLNLQPTISVLMLCYSYLALPIVSNRGNTQRLLILNYLIVYYINQRINHIFFHKICLRKRENTLGNSLETSQEILNSRHSWIQKFKPPLNQMLSQSAVISICFIDRQSVSL